MLQHVDEVLGAVGLVLDLDLMFLLGDEDQLTAHALLPVGDLGRLLAVDQ